MVRCKGASQRRELQRSIREFALTPSFPFSLLLIDELESIAYLSGMMRIEDPLSKPSVAKSSFHRIRKSLKKIFQQPLKTFRQQQTVRRRPHRDSFELMMGSSKSNGEFVPREPHPSFFMSNFEHLY